MKKVKIIRPVSLDIYKITTEKPIMTPGVHECLGWLAKFGLLVFPSLIFFMGILFFSIGLAPDDGSGTIWWLCFISLIVAIGGFLWLRWILKGGTYKPGKSFYWWRLTKEKMQLFYKVITVIVVVISIPLLIIQFKLVVLLSLIGALCGLYLIAKSFKVHEDVDYVASQELSDIIGMEIDEKVQASYIKKDIVMLLSDKKIICSYHDGNRWNFLNKRIDEIAKIGIYTPVMMGSFFNTELYFILLFTDSTKVELKMDLGDKITSNPDLFFRKLLVTLDAVLLGKVDETIKSRRRVSVNSEAKSNIETNKQESKGRSIDISTQVIPCLQDAKPVESGRVLEL